MKLSKNIHLAAESVDESEVRRRGIGFIDGSINGYVLLLGDDVAATTSLLGALMQRKILVFVAEVSLRDALRESGQILSWDSGVVPLDLSDALSFIIRVAQVFGSTTNHAEALSYACQRLYGFTLLLGESTPERLTWAQLALPLGCPLLSTIELPAKVKNWKISAECRPAIGGLRLNDIVQTGMEERGLQIHVTIPEIPVGYGTDFSGQTVRDEICGVCFTGVELTVIGENILDGRVTLIGPGIDAAGGDQALAMLVEVSGREMQPDFESVLERQIETILNDVDGVAHRGQRSSVTLRIHQQAIQKGLRLHHLGEILHARLHNEFGNILSRVQVTIMTEPGQIQVVREKAQSIYKLRDQRLSRLIDEDVDTFYTCNLCQTIAAGHLCVISPEHPGTCGAVDWMDARAAVSIRPVGPNKVVKKTGLLDARLGQWESVNRIVAQETGGVLTAYSLYSMMRDPGSACGDFECITAMLPLTNGVMVIENTCEGMTPSGMDRAMLYEIVAAGAPVPGFLGHSKRALHSDKFIAAEGGWRRIVWMNHALREDLRLVLDTLAISEGIPGFVEMIATEENVLTEEEILAHMQAVRHPVLGMEPMI